MKCTFPIPLSDRIVQSGKYLAIVFFTLEGFLAFAQCDTSLPNSRDGSFSPDGSKIVFSSSRHGDQDIYVMNADGSDQRWLAGTPLADYYPHYSQDGSKIYFDGYSDSTAVIYVMDADGSNIIALTELNQFNADPSISPNGKVVAFYSGRSGVDQIYTMDSDGSNQQRLFESDSRETTPVWSPDGKDILFISMRDGNSEIYITDRRGKKFKRVTKNPGTDRVAAWSWDGSKIIYYSKEPSSSDPKAQAEICVILPDGSGKTFITSDSFPDQGPSFSPDGKYVIYTSCRGNRELYLLKLDDGKAVRLTYSMK